MLPSNPILDANATLTALESLRDVVPLPHEHPLWGFLLLRDRIQAMQEAGLGGDAGGNVALLSALLPFFDAAFGASRTDVGRDDWQHHVAADFVDNRPYLQAYSYLYFHFVRRDLGLSTREIAEAASVGERSMRRKRERGATYLAADLVAGEKALREQRHHERLRLAVPRHGHYNLYERQVVVEDAVYALPETSVLLFGMPGVGKTLLAAAIAHQCINTKALEALFWVSLTATLPLALQLFDALEIGLNQAEDRWTVLREQRVLLVMDDLQPHHVAELLQIGLPDSVWLVGTSVVAYAEWQGATFEVAPLSRESCWAYFQNLRGTVPDAAFDDMFDKSGGVPSAISQLVREYHMSSEGVVDLDVYFATVWATLSHEQQDICYLVFYASEAGVPKSLLKTLCQVDNATVNALVQQHVLRLTRDVEPALFYMGNAAKRSLKHQVEAHRFKLIDLPFVEMPMTKDDLIALLTILQNMPPEPDWRLLNWLATRVVELGVWGHWGHFLEDVTPLLQESAYGKQWVALAVASLQRWAGQYVDSYRALKNVHDTAGQQGFFDLQAQTMLEQAHILAYQERWADLEALATYLMTRLEQIGEENELVERAQYLQITALVHEDAEAALAQIETMVISTPQQAILASGACLALGDTEQAVRYCKQALDWAAPNTPRYGRVLCNLAMAYYANDQMQVATNYQIQAVNLLDTMADLGGQARAYNNLGVLYFAQEETSAAGKAWQMAFDRLLRLQDGVGMQVVRENLSLLERQYSSRPSPQFLDS